MREIAEFRVDEQFAHMLFSSHEGRRLGESVRKITISTDDPRFQQIGEMQRHLRQTAGQPFFYGWDIARIYTAEELASARLFHVTTTATFEPTGEECGTAYDESVACPDCGAGARQNGPLMLDEKRLPKGKDFAETIGSERVLSRRACDLFIQRGITGVDFRPIRSRGVKGNEISEWRQFVVTHATAEIVPPTLVGVGLFDHDPEGRYRCPAGHLLGLNLISELFVRATSVPETDVVESRQYIGIRRGLLRPWRALLLSPRLRQMIVSEKLKGFGLERAQVV